MGATSFSSSARIPHCRRRSRNVFAPPAGPGRRSCLRCGGRKRIVRSCWSRSARSTPTATGWTGRGCIHRAATSCRFRRTRGSGNGSGSRATASCRRSSGTKGRTSASRPVLQVGGPARYALLGIRPEHALVPLPCRPPRPGRGGPAGGRLFGDGAGGSVGGIRRRPARAAQSLLRQGVVPAAPTSRRPFSSCCPAPRREKPRSSSSACRQGTRRARPARRSMSTGPSGSTAVRQTLRSTNR